MKLVFVPCLVFLLILSACAVEATDPVKNDKAAAYSTTQSSRSVQTQVVGQTATFQPVPTLTNVAPLLKTVEQGVVSTPAACRTIEKTTPNPTVQALLPPPSEKDWVRGPVDARVTILDYSDFQ